jgi:hypothetical protein
LVRLGIVLLIASTAIHDGDPVAQRVRFVHQMGGLGPEASPAGGRAVDGDGSINLSCPVRVRSLASRRSCFPLMINCDD